MKSVILDDGKILTVFTSNRERIAFNSHVKYWHNLNKYSGIKIPEQYKEYMKNIDEIVNEYNKNLKDGSKNC